MKNTIFPILAILFVSPFAFAEEKNDTIEIFFNQGKYEIVPSLNHNKDNLNRLDSITELDALRLREINIVGSASPEGSVPLNYNLSDNRAEKILSVIAKNHEYSDSIVNVSFVGRDWQRLLEFAEEDPNIPYKDETISFLQETVEEINGLENGVEKESDHYLEKLKKIRNGIPYSYLYNNIFPSLRSTRVYLNYRLLPSFDGTISTPNISIGTLYPSSDINITYLQFSPTQKEGRNFYMALKTNLLYDALALPSLSAEFYLGKDFSAVANWTYGWWDKDSAHRYWRAYGGDIALRWWFGKAAAKKPLTGHHLGIYGGIMTYDFEFGGKGYMGGLPHETLWNRSLRSAGIEYGYSLPIANRLNLDFTIGIGYLGGKYIKYIPDDGRYIWQSTHKINWFGPTKAEISLVWLIGKGNFNAPKKGGLK